jgi:rRNA maturation endonuclease Nob1
MRMSCQGEGSHPFVCFHCHTHYRLHTTDYTLQTTHYRLQTTDYTLHTTDYTLHTTDYRLGLLIQGRQTSAGITTHGRFSAVCCRCALQNCSGGTHKFQP